MNSVPCLRHQGRFWLRQPREWQVPRKRKKRKDKLLYEKFSKLGFWQLVPPNSPGVSSKQVWGLPLAFLKVKMLPARFENRIGVGEYIGSHSQCLGLILGHCREASHRSAPGMICSTRNKATVSCIKGIHLIHFFHLFSPKNRKFECIINLKSIFKNPGTNVESVTINISELGP